MGISDAMSQREHGHQSRTDPGDFQSLTTFRKCSLIATRDFTESGLSLSFCR